MMAGAPLPNAAQARNRVAQVRAGIITSTLSRGAAAVAPIITVPIALEALGKDHYGAWSAALAMTALAVFADLGLGAGLMTRLSGAIAVGDSELSRKLVSTAYACLTAAVSVLLVGLWFSGALLDWGSFLAGSSGRGDHDIEVIVLLTLSAFLLNVVASLIVRVQYAVGHMGRSNLWQASATCLGVVGMFLAAQLDASGAAFVAVAAFITPTVALLNTLTFFRSKVGSPLRPQVGAADFDTARGLMSLGLGFLAITVLMGLSISIDTWIVGRVSSLTDAADFSVTLRVFAVIGTSVSILSIPLWPSHAAALSSGDVQWVRRVTRRMLVLSPLIVCLVSVAAVLLFPHVIPIWLGQEFRISKPLLWGFACWNVVQAIAAPLFMVQNAAGVLRPQLLGYLALLVVIPAKWVVVETLNFSWVPFVTVVGYTLFILPAAIVGYRAALERPAVPFDREGVHA